MVVSSAQWSSPDVHLTCSPRYKESFTSTGAMSRSFTSTYAAIDTKASRQLVRLDRNPNKKVGQTPRLLSQLDSEYSVEPPLMAECLPLVVHPASTNMVCAGLCTTAHHTG